MSDVERAAPASALTMKTIRLHDGKERALARRHPWVFEGAIARGGADFGETAHVEAANGSDRLFDLSSASDAGGSMSNGTFEFDLIDPSEREKLDQCTVADHSGDGQIDVNEHAQPIDAATSPWTGVYATPFPRPSAHAGEDMKEMAL